MFLLFISPVSLLGLNLERLSNINLSNNELLDVEYRNGHLVIPAGLGGTVVVDVRDPANPMQVSSYYAHSCPYGRFYNTFIGDGVVVGTGRNCPLSLLDVIDGYGFQQISEHQTGDFSYEDAAIVDTLLVTAAHGDGIEMVDISDPYSPVSLGSVALDNAWAVRVNDGYAYVADGGSGLTVVDLSDPTRPAVVSRFPTNGSAKDVRVMNGYAFLALGDAGLVMIDISDPLAPFLVAEYNTSGLAAHIGVNDSLVAVADWDDVEILKYGSGNTLELVGEKNTGGRVMGVDISGDVVYVAEWSLLQIYRYGPIAGADLDVDLVDIRFPRTDIGESRDTTIVLSNNGGSTLTINSIEVSSGDFTVDTTPPVHVQPGGTFPLDIQYTASDDEGPKERITFRSNDTDEPVFRIDVWGNNLDLHVGDPAPDFTLPVLDDGTVTLSELQGSVVVLSFFASW